MKIAAVMLGLCLWATSLWAGEYKSMIATQMTVVTMQEAPIEKVPRSKCPICKGTGKVKAGDTVTVVWRECDNCYDDGATPTPNVGDEHCNKPNCPCPDCTCGDNCHCQHCQHCKDADQTIETSAETLAETPVVERSRRMLFFGAPWCRWCLWMKGDLKPWNETQTRNAALTRLVGRGWTVGPEASNHIQLLNYDEEPELREQYDVQDLPTLILIENGVEITRHVGVLDAYQIGAMFDTPAPQPAAEPAANCAQPQQQPGAFLNMKFGKLQNVRKHVLDFRSMLEALGPTGTVRLAPDGPGREVILAVSSAASVKITTPFAVNYRLEADKIVLTFSDPQPVGHYRILQGAVTSVEVTATRIDIALDGLPDGYLEIES